MIAPMAHSSLTRQQAQMWTTVSSLSTLQKTWMAWDGKIVDKSRSPAQVELAETSSWSFVQMLSTLEEPLRGETCLEVPVGIEACMHQLQLYRYVDLPPNMICILTVTMTMTLTHTLQLSNNRCMKLAIILATITVERMEWHMLILRVTWGTRVLGLTQELISASMQPRHGPISGTNLITWLLIPPVRPMMVLLWLSMRSRTVLMSYSRIFRSA